MFRLISSPRPNLFLANAAALDEVRARRLSAEGRLTPPCATQCGSVRGFCALVLVFVSTKRPPRLELRRDEGGGDLRERRPGRPALRGRTRSRVPRGLRADRCRADQRRGRGPP